MNTVTENDFIRKMAYGNNFAFVINDNNTFLSTEYKVLQSQSESFIKCMKLLYNGKIQLYYLTSGYKSLADILPTLGGDNFTSIVASLFSNIIDVKSNGFLSCQSIDVSFEHIFVDLSTYRTALVYLPIGKRLFNNTLTFENELRTSLIKLIQNTPSLSTPKTMQLLSDLSNGMITLEAIYSKIKGTLGAERIPQVDNAGGESINRKNIKLIAIDAPVAFEISVTKDEFIIGKKQELVDGVISFNRMISRTHCKIVRQGNQFSVIDLNSANGTYVNRVRLQPEQSCTIKDGDVIRLANSEFQVCIV